MKTEQFWRDAERHVARYGTTFVSRIIQWATGTHLALACRANDDLLDIDVRIGADGVGNGIGDGHRTDGVAPVVDHVAAGHRIADRVRQLALHYAGRDRRNSQPWRGLQPQS